MDNFAERIAYWYFRLNGCLLLENFVHHGRPNDRRASDTDLVAVRLPYAQERIGDRPLPLDDWATIFGVQTSGKSLAFIVQVKGGGGEIEGAFAPDRIDDAIRRVGALDEGAVREVVTTLGTESHAMSGDWIVLKVVIGADASVGSHHIPLAAAHSFVRERFRNFVDRKRRDWTFFTDPLVQLIAWEEAGCG